MKRLLKFILFVFFVGIILSAGFFLLSKKENPRFDAKEINSAQNVEQKAISNNQEEASIESEKKNMTQEQTAPEEQPAQDIPEKFLLEMPFYSQAPLSEWDEFHEDMCEEASVLNAAYYLLDKKLSKEDYEKELQKMQDVEKKEVGAWKSTTVAQIKKVSDIYFEGKIKSKIIENPTVEEIESEIAQNNPVVVPLAGRDIGNPNFTPPGPVYHMLTIKGYDSQNFITNDVGTRKGNSYVYKKEVIMKNIHDWNEKDIYLGGKRALVLYK